MSAGMMETTAAVAREKDRPSYLNGLDNDGSPESYPEVARELTLLRGAATSVDMAINNVFEEFNLLSRALQPVVDQTPRPMLDPGQPVAGSSIPTVTTPVGGDIRHVYEHLGSLEAQLGTLASRLRDLRTTVRL